MFTNRQTLISRFTSPQPPSPASSPARAVAATLTLGIALTLAGCAGRVMSGLVEHAARQDRDVRMVAERGPAARARQKINRGWLLLDADLSAGRSKG